MSGRTDKVHRILAVQRQLHRIEEWKIADLHRQLEELGAAQRGVIGALNEHDALQGLFLDAMARRLRALADEEVNTRRERDAQQRVLAEQGTRVACLERLANALDQERFRASAKTELMDIVERHVGAAAQASRKISET
jgi:uncharacterized coiled-coil protein SlyX